jgi:hypothetical protein
MSDTENLVLVVQSGDMDTLVKLLCADSQLVNATDHAGWSPLLVAASTHHLGIFVGFFGVSFMHSHNDRACDLLIATWCQYSSQNC